MSNADSCCISEFVVDKCHSDGFRADKILHKINTIAKENLELLNLRVTGLKNIENESICDYHFKRYVSFYSSKEWKCCDPYSQHVKPINSSLMIITLEFSKKINKICKFSIIPGKKLCRNCYTQFSTQIKDYEEQLKYCVDPLNRHRNKVDNSLCCLEQKLIDYLKDVLNLTFSSEHNICITCKEKLISDLCIHKNTAENSPKDVAETLVDSRSDIKTDSQTTNSTCSEFQSGSQKKRSLDEVLDVLGIPAFKRQKLNYERTVEEGVAIVQTTVNNVTDKFEEACNVKLPKYKNLKKMSFESFSFNAIIFNMQSTYNVSNTDRKISLLTLLPPDWTVQKVNEYFDCSKYMFNEAKKLRVEKGTFIVYYTNNNDIYFIA